VDGLYTAAPETDPNATHIPMVKSISADIEAMATGAASHLSRGGMITKIEAGKIATQSGTSMIIAKGEDMHPLLALTKGARHTLFTAKQSPTAARKRWILGTLEITGQVYVDAGAAKALLSGKSLLPIGITKIKGAFSRGDAISIIGPDDKEIARGLAGMNNEDANLAKGKKSHAIVGMFGAQNRTELVHADDLVLVNA
jgi:glutamate 5-kinase